MPAELLTRRRLLFAGSGVVFAGVAGALAGLVVPRRTHHPNKAQVIPPAVLTDALAREADLIASLESATTVGSIPADVLRAVRADHVAHRDAIRAEITGIPGYSPSTSGSASTSATASPTTPARPAPTVSSLRAAERAAQRAAAAASATQSGTRAVLFASIAACEATHVELFS